MALPIEIAPSVLPVDFSKLGEALVAARERGRIRAAEILSGEDMLSADAFAQPVPLGIFAGLFFGKQLGVFSFSWAAIRWGWADRPARSGWLQLYGVSLLCGVGFTMSLFIGLLAFPESPELGDQVKIGVIAGSVLSAVAGAGVLLWAGRKRRV